VNPAADWGNFLVAVAGAAAALTGLIFVAISINLTRILEFPGVSIRASEALAVLMEALLISLAALAPNQPRYALAIEILAVGIAVWLMITAGHVRTVSLGLRVPRGIFAFRVVVYQLAMLPFLVAGVALLLGWRGAMLWLLPGCLFSFVAAIQGAWVLLIEIVR
jgi:hypothetical protein